jgi:hypothetical protein
MVNLLRPALSRGVRRDDREELFDRVDFRENRQIQSSRRF